jgi:hypothetical protein
LNLKLVQTAKLVAAFLFIMSGTIDLVLFAEKGFLVPSWTISIMSFMFAVVLLAEVVSCLTGG